MVMPRTPIRKWTHLHDGRRHFGAGQGRAAVQQHGRQHPRVPSAPPQPPPEQPPPLLSSSSPPQPGRIHSITMNPAHFPVLMDYVHLAGPQWHPSILPNFSFPHHTLFQTLSDVMSTCLEVCPGPNTPIDYGRLIRDPSLSYSVKILI